MLCRIARRKVSGALDSGQPISGSVKRHLLGCASCREFAAFAEETGRRLVRDAGALVGSVDQAFAERIKASLGEPETVPDGADLRLRPRRSLRSARDDASQPGSRRRIGFRLTPVLAAAAAWVVIGASVVWMVKSRPQNASDITPLFQIEQPGKYLVAAMERVNSPYEQEMQLWKQTLDGAAERLKAAFDIGLGE